MKISVDKIKVKEEYLRIVPRPIKEDYEALRRSIEEHGIRMPLILNGDYVLLDGHTRLEIAKKLNMREVPCEIISFPDELEEKLFVIDVNRSRRHLNPAQRIELARLEWELERERARRRKLAQLKQFKADEEIENFTKKFATDVRSERTSESNNIVNNQEDDFSEMGRAIRIVAKKHGISDNTLRKGIEILDMVEKGDEEVKKAWEKAKAGKLSVNRVYTLVKRKKIEKEVNKENNVAIPLEIKIIHGDFREKLRELPDNSISLIFTDPPYGQEYISLYEDLAKIAAQKLKPGGSLIAFCGHYALPKLLPAMSKHLKFWWLLAVRHQNKYARLPGKNVFVTWKPLLWFVKGSLNSGEFVFDMVDSTTPDKTFHDWAQSVTEAEYYISRLTKEGDLVVDPFMGSGTFVYVAYKLKRRVIGIDRDKEAVRLAEVNIKNALKNNA